MGKQGTSGVTSVLNSSNTSRVRTKDKKYLTSGIITGKGHMIFKPTNSNQAESKIPVSEANGDSLTEVPTSSESAQAKALPVLTSAEVAEHSKPATDSELMHGFECLQTWRCPK